MKYLGIDLAKTKLDCVLLDPATQRGTSKSVESTPAGVKTLLEWTLKQGVPALAELHVVREATGVYHETAALALVEAGVRVSVLNPAQVKDVARGWAVRTKTDAPDRVVLARYGALVKPDAWQPPPPEVRELKALLARLEALAAAWRRENNRQDEAKVSSAPALILESLEKTLTVLKQARERLQRVINDPIDR